MAEPDHCAGGGLGKGSGKRGGEDCGEQAHGQDLSAHLISLRVR